MPVKLGESGTMGCEGEKPWPLVNVETGQKEACSGPDRDTAMRAMQARNMAHAGLLKRTWRRVYEAFKGKAVDEEALPPWIRLHAANREKPPWIELSRSVRVIKQDDEKRVALGVVMEPADPNEITNWLQAGKPDPPPRGVDSQGDYCFAPEIKDAAYAYMANYRRGAGIKIMHAGEIVKDANVVESYIALADFGDGDQRVWKDSWLLGTQFGDPLLWAAIKDKMAKGGYSIGGRGQRSEE